MKEKGINIIVIFFFALFLTTVLFTFQILKPFFYPIAWAIILSLIFFPAQQFLVKLFHGKKTLAALILTALATLIIIIPCFFIFLTLVRQGSEFYQHANSSLQHDRFNLFLEKYINQGAIDTMEGKLAPLGITVGSIREYLIAKFETFGNFMVGQTKAMILNMLRLIIKGVFTILILFFLLRDGERFFGVIRELLPLNKEDKDFIMNTFYDTTRGVVLALIVSAIIQGATLLIAYIGIGIPYAIFWGILSLCAAFIPVVGVTLIWIPISIYTLINIGLFPCIILLTLGLVVIIVADNVIRPYLISEKVKIHVFILFLSVIGGLLYFGFIGVFLGPLIIATFLGFLKIFKREYLPE